MIWAFEILLHRGEGAESENGFLPDVSTCADLRRNAIRILWYKTGGCWVYPKCSPIFCCWGDHGARSI
jgi:hypothetical protein